MLFVTGVESFGGADEPEASWSIDAGSGDPGRELEAPEVRPHPPVPANTCDARLGEPELLGERSDQRWVADLAYVRAQSSWLYVAVVLDVWSRLVVGWAMETHLRFELVEKALAMVVLRRQSKAVIYHSDQGMQYTSAAVGKGCREAGVRPTIRSVGDACDDAMCESFFPTLNYELLQHHRFENLNQARRAAFVFIERFHNRQRRHSALGYESPLHYEQQQVTYVDRTDRDCTPRVNCCPEGASISSGEKPCSAPTDGA